MTSTRPGLLLQDSPSLQGPVEPEPLNHFLGMFDGGEVDTRLLDLLEVMRSHSAWNPSSLEIM